MGQRSLAFVTLTLITLTLPAFAAGNGAAAHTVVLNVIELEDTGCAAAAGDAVTLDVRVRAGHVVVDGPSVDAGAGTPPFALVHVPVDDVPARVAVHVTVTRAGNATTTCDLTPGTGNWLNLTVDADGALVNATGADAASAHVTVFAAADPPHVPEPPVFTDTGSGTQHVNVRWAPPEAHAAGTRFFAETNAARLELELDDRDFLVTPGNPEEPALVRGIAELDAWHVAGPWTPFRIGNFTRPNVAVCLEDEHGFPTIAWEAREAEAAHVEVHAALREDFVPSDATRVTTVRGNPWVDGTEYGHLQVTSLPVNATAWLRLVLRDANDHERVTRAYPVPPGENERPLSACNPFTTMRHITSPGTWDAPRAEDAFEGVTVRWNPFPDDEVTKYDVLVREDALVDAWRVRAVVDANATLVLLPRLDLPVSTPLEIRARAFTAAGTIQESHVTRVHRGPWNAAPSPGFLVTAPLMAWEDVVRVRPGDVVTFDARDSSDPDGDPLNFTWTWDDDSPPGFGAVTTHAFSEAGHYRVRLRVEDALGAGAEAQNVTVLVREAHSQGAGAHVPGPGFAVGLVSLAVVARNLLPASVRTRA